MVLEFFICDILGRLIIIVIELCFFFLGVDLNNRIYSFIKVIVKDNGVFLFSIREF